MLIFALPYFHHTLQAIALNSLKSASIIGYVLRPLYPCFVTLAVV
ncbi:hypothetical protein [Nostoc sp.]